MAKDKKVDPRCGEEVMVSHSGNFENGTVRGIVKEFDSQSKIVTVKTEGGDLRVPRGNIRKVLHG